MHQQQTPKSQWKALWSAFRAARHDLAVEREDGWTVLPHADVAAVHAAATAAQAGVRAGFCLRHAGKLPRVWVDAGVQPRAMSRGLEAALYEAQLRREGLVLPEPEDLPPALTEEEFLRRYGAAA